MTLPDLIAEIDKLDFGYKTIVQSKLKVVLGIMRTIKGAEHLVSAPAPKPPKQEPKKAKKPPVDPMPRGG